MLGDLKVFCTPKSHPLFPRPPGRRLAPQGWSAGELKNLKDSTCGSLFALMSRYRSRVLRTWVCAVVHIILRNRAGLRKTSLSIYACCVCACYCFPSGAQETFFGDILRKCLAQHKRNSASSTAAMVNAISPKKGLGWAFGWREVASHRADLVLGPWVRSNEPSQSCKDHRPSLALPHCGHTTVNASQTPIGGDPSTHSLSANSKHTQTPTHSRLT